MEVTTCCRKLQQIPQAQPWMHCKQSGGSWLPSWTNGVHQRQTAWLPQKTVWTAKIKTGCAKHSTWHTVHYAVSNTRKNMTITTCTHATRCRGTNLVLSTTATTHCSYMTRCNSSLLFCLNVALRATKEGTPGSGVVELVVRPAVAFPDTNCFLDHLDLIGKLMDSQQCTLAIPLTVINELRGLSKGQENSEKPQEAAARAAQANSAVAFVEQKFQSKQRRLVAVTYKGNVLRSIAFQAAAEPTDQAKPKTTNDDRILQACRLHSLMQRRDPQDPDDKGHLVRSVVLLTGDRNMQLKAHAANVPVKPISGFCNWLLFGADTP
eukprot:m.341249 g.341249  ORF g.341249 m.341249 type:complete len:322 (+) comp19831_c2_seq7:2962-3927(+)